MVQPVYHKIDQQRWQKFSPREQLLHMASELNRADHWQYSDEVKFKAALERLLELIDASIDDRRWGDNRPMLWFLRDEIAKLYIGQKKTPIGYLYRAI